MPANLRSSEPDYEAGQRSTGQKCRFLVSAFLILVVRAWLGPVAARGLRDCEGVWLRAGRAGWRLKDAGWCDVSELDFDRLFAVFRPELELVLA